MEAAAARDRLQTALLHAPLNASDLDPRLRQLSIGYKPDQEVPSAMVAEALSLLALGELDVRFADVKVCPVVVSFMLDTSVLYTSF